ncbi:hypothetical protein [Sphingomonas sp.]|uniref:hypothetical protein n=1 Tax=Sphingomonas sp. TaxID=28214 RepID=UPI002C8FA2B0|nr:hypothetical protein [Sphingomonas sp.]HTG38873.1 hypothetical protein [Sphingomonas sp.]
MSQITSPSHRSNDGLRVGMPGVGDRLSGALRGAYRRERNLPEDMTALLHALDNRTTHRD